MPLTGYQAELSPTLSHFYPNAEERYTALKSLPHLQPWRAIAINMGVYLLWQAAYYRYVIIARKEKIKQGRPTSFTWMVNDRRRLVGKIAARVPEQYREGTFMVRFLLVPTVPRSSCVIVR